MLCHDAAGSFRHAGRQDYFGPISADLHRDLGGSNRHEQKKDLRNLGSVTRHIAPSVEKWRRQAPPRYAAFPIPAVTNFRR
jgi:hypothetical protein